VALGPVNESIQEKLVQAFLDPKIASQLMKKATPERMKSIGQTLRESVRGTGAGALHAAGAGVRE
jgi:hypothetical protein